MPPTQPTGLSLRKSAIGHRDSENRGASLCSPADGACRRRSRSGRNPFRARPRPDRCTRATAGFVGSIRGKGPGCPGAPSQLKRPAPSAGRKASPSAVCGHLQYGTAKTGREVASSTSNDPHATMNNRSRSQRRSRPGRFAIGPRFHTPRTTSRSNPVPLVVPAAFSDCTSQSVVLRHIALQVLPMKNPASRRRDLKWWTRSGSN